MLASIQDNSSPNLTAMHVPNVNRHGDRYIPNQMPPSELNKESPAPEAQVMEEELSIQKRLARLEEKFKLFVEQPTNHPAALYGFLETAEHGGDGDETIAFENSAVESTLDDDAHDPRKSDINKLEESEKIIAEQRNENKRLLDLLKEREREPRTTEGQAETSVTDPKDQIIAELRNFIAEQESEKEYLMNSLVEVTADANSARDNTDELSKTITWAMNQVENHDEVPWVGYKHWDTANRLLTHIRSLHEKIGLLEESMSQQRYKASVNQFKQKSTIQDLTTELTNTRVSKGIKSYEIKQLRNDIEQKDAWIADLDKRLRDQHEEHKNNTEELNKKIQMLQNRIRSLEFENIDSSVSPVFDEGWTNVLSNAWPWEKSV